MRRFYFYSVSFLAGCVSLWFFVNGFDKYWLLAGMFLNWIGLAVIVRQDRLFDIIHGLFSTTLLVREIVRAYVTKLPVAA
jgi:hypothetical protein